jgi:hypothetical protein
MVGGDIYLEPLVASRHSEAAVVDGDVASSTNCLSGTTDVGPFVRGENHRARLFVFYAIGPHQE